MSKPRAAASPSRESDTRRSLARSIRDGCAHAAMLGLGEAWLAAYGIFLGLSPLTLGLLASLPIFVGSLAQQLTLRILDRAAPRRPLVVGGVVVQASTWAVMPLLLLLPSGWSAPALLLIALAYFALGGLITPAWSSWMGDVVPPRVRGAWFGVREQLRMAFQLGTLLAAGGILAAARRSGAEWAGFATLFGLACAARLFSAHYLRQQHEPPAPPTAPGDVFSLRDFLRRTPFSNFGRFTVYVALILAATHLASPFFSLFMLRDLGFSYVQFTASSAAVLLAQVATLRAWGRLGDRFGNRLLVRVTGILIPVPPILWLVSSRFEAILVWQVLGGIVWAGFNLATANFLFDAVSPPKRARCVAYYNMLVNGGMLVGATLGGIVAPLLAPRILTPWGTIELASGLQVLFLLSGLARLPLTLAFLPVIREVRPVQHFGSVLVRMTGLAAARGLRLGVFPASSRRESKGPGGGKPTAASDADGRSTTGTG